MNIDKDRVLGFSDAVFAFAATLLVLKIDLPGITSAQITNTTDFLQLFQHLWPQYLANIISFVVIGYYWLNHHAIFSMVKRYDARLVWLNIFFLICVSFLPFPVDLYGENMTNPIIVVFYSASLALVGYMLYIVWWYGSRGQFSARYLIAPIVFTLSIPLVYIHPLLAQMCWILIVAGNMLVDKMFKFEKD